MSPEKQLKVLQDRYRPHTQFWDCYNDEALEENHLKLMIVKYCSDMIREVQNHGNGDIKHWKLTKKLAQLWK